MNSESSNELLVVDKLILDCHEVEVVDEAEDQARGNILEEVSTILTFFSWPHGLSSIPEFGHTLTHWVTLLSCDSFLSIQLSQLHSPGRRESREKTGRWKEKKVGGLHSVQWNWPEKKFSNAKLRKRILQIESLFEREYDFLFFKKSTHHTVWGLVL